MKYLRIFVIHGIILNFLLISASHYTVNAQENATIDDVLTVIHRRKSVRKYLDKPVSREHLITLMKAGMAAPSAADKRPWSFVAVTDKALLDSLSHSSPTGKQLKNAAAAIVVCGDTRRALNSNV